jgi:hypothetical protein
VKLKRHAHTHHPSDAERINLAGEYNKGRAEATPELGYPALTLDEYVRLVDAFGQSMAKTFDRTPDDPDRTCRFLPYEIDDLLRGLDERFEEAEWPKDKNVA